MAVRRVPDMKKRRDREVRERRRIVRRWTVLIVRIKTIAPKIEPTEETCIKRMELADSSV